MTALERSTVIFPFGSKTKRLNHSDGEEEKTESQKKKRRRIKKPQPDSSDDEGKTSCTGPAVSLAPAFLQKFILHAA